MKTEVHWFQYLSDIFSRSAEKVVIPELTYDGETETSTNNDISCMNATEMRSLNK